MTPKQIVLLIAAAAVVAFVVWDQLRRTPEVQVPATFARLATAMNEHDASGVMACVDRSYDFSGRWPNLFPEPTKARGLAQQGLAFAFLRAGQEPVTMTWTLEEVKPQADGSVQASVSLEVKGGLFTNAVPALSHHRFTLVKGGWISGRYRISDHAPFTVNAPEM